MVYTRREILRLTGIGLPLGVSGCVRVRDVQLMDTPSCDIACFEFEHEGFDDAPDYLTITMVEGRGLPAKEVYVTGVATEWPPQSDSGQTKPWHELSYLGPTESIAGHSIRVDLAYVSTVHVLWRHDDEEHTLDTWEDD